VRFNNHVDCHLPLIAIPSTFLLCGRKNNNNNSGGVIPAGCEREEITRAAAEAGMNLVSQ